MSRSNKGRRLDARSAGKEKVRARETARGPRRAEPHPLTPAQTRLTLVGWDEV
jgi:hypothetical protein